MCVPTTRFLLSTSKRGDNRINCTRDGQGCDCALHNKGFLHGFIPPHRKHMAWRFFRLSGFGASFFFSFCFTGVAFRVLRAEGRAAEGWRALARPRREVRERPRGPPRGRTLSRARHSLAAPGFRVAASGIGIQHPHTQQRRGAELRTPRRERNESEKNSPEEDDGRFPCVPLPFALRLVAWRLSGVSRSRVVSYLAASCSRGAEREREWGEQKKRN